MKKKVVISILFMVFVLGLVGCTNNLSKEAINQGKQALENKEYDKALASFEIALDKDSKNQEASTMKSIINDYLTAKEYLEQAKVEEAEKALKGINSQYSEYLIKDDINNLKTRIDEEIKNKSIAEQKVAEDNKNKAATEQKITEDNKNTEKVEVHKSKRELYINKLNNIESGLTDLEDKYAGTTMEMKEAAGMEYERWDKALNEIYAELKLQMAPSEMKQLTEKQIKWISYRDNEAKKYSLEFEGGTMEPVSYLGSLGQTTKDRCYELVENYMR
ncbi:lysozyme inhibitor LprI family protein [Clostridium algidicarnis]|uniref:DUF1311 domain-containing protein n=1 Tax=Clostridium algidicarnis TaxID=37659 RepID=A0ABS6C6E1_9CLOT|nr:lysozyme inhibitor LprI family protein [Clostridium algidicarnis]MBU3221052.1 DUF1311 domain-containing protein [Clostridium algidicarnis]